MVIYIVGSGPLTLCEVQIFTDGNRSVSFNFNLIDSGLNYDNRTIAKLCIFCRDAEWKSGDIQRCLSKYNIHLIHCRQVSIILCDRENSIVTKFSTLTSKFHYVKKIHL